MASYPNTLIFGRTVDGANVPLLVEEDGTLVVSRTVVQVATAGALSGDGSSGSKLAVKVDGVTIDVNGSNQLEVKGGSVAFTAIGLGTATPGQGVDGAGTVGLLSIVKTFATDGSTDLEPFGVASTVARTGDGGSVYNATYELDLTDAHDLNGYYNQYISTAFHGAGTASYLFSSIYNETNIYSGTLDNGAFGLYNTVLLRGGTVTSGLYGAYIFAQAITAGVTDYIIGVDVNVNAEVGATATDVYGVAIEAGPNPGGGASTDNWYGFWIGDQTGQATNVWPIYYDGPSAHRFTVDVDAVVTAHGYKSSDGSAGVTAGPFTVITAITVKNGLVTSITGT